MSELGTADRATLRAWRVANFLGWSAVAIAGSIVLRFGAESAGGLWGIGFGEVATPANGWKYLLIVAIPSAALVAAFVGYIVGSRMVRHAVASAAVLATLYASGASWLFWGSLRYSNETAVLVGLTVSSFLSVPVAAVLARVLTRAPMRRSGRR